MTFKINHDKVSAKADGTDATRIQPSDWNADLVSEMATAKILGRTTSGTGVVEELDVDAVKTFLGIDSGASFVIQAGSYALTLTWSGTELGVKADDVSKGNLAFTDDIPSLSGYSTTTAMNSAISSALSPYATTSSLSAYATTSSLSSYATTSSANSTFAQSVRLADAGSASADFGDNTPVEISGAVMVTLRITGSTQTIFCRYLQYNVNGSWFTAGVV